MRRLLLVFLGALALSGCFVFHDDYPDRSCGNSTDCFRAQGEVCDLQTKTCVPAPDAAPPPPTPDAGVDATAADDAAITDATVNDATVNDARVNDAM